MMTIRRDRHGVERWEPGAVTGLTLGGIVGGIIAAILHQEYGSDFGVDLHNPDDIERLQSCALFQPH